MHLSYCCLRVWPVHWLIILYWRAHVASLDLMEPSEQASLTRAGFQFVVQLDKEEEMRIANPPDYDEPVPLDGEYI
jgi:hypothetical protein